MNRREALCGVLGAIAASSCGTLGQVRLPKSREARAQMLRPRFDAAELLAIDRGASVTREVAFGHDGSKYIGAISAVIVRTDPDIALANMLRIEAIGNWLPFNHKADVVAERNGEKVVEMLQGVDPFLATLSILVRPDDGVIHVDLARDRPHDIDDLWAFIAARRYDAAHALITCGIAVDMGRGALRLIEKEVQGTFSWIIDDIRSFLESANLAPEMQAIGRADEVHGPD